MARFGLAGLVAAGLALLVACTLWSGRPPLGLFMALAFPAFFSIGILFGNLNAMAMRSLSNLAGLGASLIASGSSLVSTLFAVLFSHFYDGTLFALSAGFTIAGTLAFLLTRHALRSDATPITAAII